MNSVDRAILEHRLRTSLEARNFEVTQLATRNNFFMVFQGVLLSGLVQVSAAVPPVVAFTVCALGVFMSALQLGMASGAKFWQERWEHDLEAAERDWLSAMSAEPHRTVATPQLFSLPVKESESIVRGRLESPDSIPNVLVHRFSVSKIPIYAASFFLVCWLALLLSTFHTPSRSLLPAQLVGFPPAASAASTAR